MAKFSDYVKDQVDEELEQIAPAQKTESQSNPDVPDRFKGKSAAEIAQSYAELEKLNSRQAQELGRQRKLSEELLALESRKGEVTEPPAQTKPVTVDDLYENADGHIRRLVREETSDRVAKLEAELSAARQARRMEGFTAQYPNWQSQVKDPAFLNWIAESGYRVKLANAADAGDLDSAEVLFGLYQDLKGKARKSTEDTRRREKELNDATLESSGPEAPDMVETFSRSELLEKRIQAKKGDEVAQRWLRNRDAKISRAYTEGRIVD